MQEGAISLLLPPQNENKPCDSMLSSRALNEQNKSLEDRRITTNNVSLKFFIYFHSVLLPGRGTERHWQPSETLATFTGSRRILMSSDVR